jgi:hypothetical protein
MVYLEFGERQISLAWLGVGVGCMLVSIVGMGIMVIYPEASLLIYAKTLPFIFILGFGGTLAAPLPHVWQVFVSKANADARQHWARGQKAVNEVQVEVIADDEPVVAATHTITREVPLNHNGVRVGEVIIEEVVNIHHAEWVARTIKFVRWCEHLNSLLSVDHIGLSVHDANDWVKYTDVLAESGYITKGNGRATKLDANWGYVGIIAALNTGGVLRHANLPPPPVANPPGVNGK